MTKNELNSLYFHWMCRLVCKGRFSKHLPYQKLFQHLNEYRFSPTLVMDENRADDGMDLRYRFGYEKALDGSVIALIDDRPCSMLEMMVALSLRCEEGIMYDPEIGDRTGEWFWDMIKSLGLTDMTDDRYDPELVDSILAKFNAGKYRRDGKGGLFYIPKTSKDMRTAEIWYQMCWYLDEVIVKGG